MKERKDNDKREKFLRKERREEKIKRRKDEEERKGNGENI